MVSLFDSLSVHGLVFQRYFQVHATAMDTKHGPSATFMSNWEQQFLYTQTKRLSQGFDGGSWIIFFTIGTHGRASLDAFLVAINQTHPTIRETLGLQHLRRGSSSPRHPRACIWAGGDRREMDLCTKPTDN